MPIDFHAERNRHTYASRDAHESWMGMVQSLVDVKGSKVVDIACGGGIYSKVFADFGAAAVTGVDFSEEMVKGAREKCAGYQQVEFVVGDAQATGLESGAYDVVLQRALIHHLDVETMQRGFAEAARVLRSGGVLLVQNRTPEDCLLPGGKEHMRGYFFDRYPRLKDKEVKRRHASETVQAALCGAGFSAIEEIQFWEVRRYYSTLEELRQDLLSRTGRSLLHELSDAELQDLVTYITDQLTAAGVTEGIVEQDRWTIWKAVKA